DVAKDVIAFEMILAGVNADEKVKGAIAAEISKSEAELQRDDNKHRDTIEDLNKMTPALDWKRIFKTVFPKDVAIPKQYKMDSRVYLMAVNKAVEMSSTQTIQNYFVWTLIHSSAKSLAPSLQTRFQESKGEELPRWKECVNSVNTKMGELAGHFFVQQILPAKSQRVVNDMITAVRWSYEKNILKYGWLDAKTRKNALQKLKAIVQSVGYSSVDPN
ncbi:Endothelin-converting enzyme 1, partial [Podila epigama]